MMYNMDISTARKDLAKLVTNLPTEGIPLERYGKVVALIVRPEYVDYEKVVAKTITAVTSVKPKVPKTKKSVMGNSDLAWLQRAKIAQKARDDLLRGINKK